MKKNVVVISGSPRKGGNSELLAEAFIRGAREAGHEVGQFDAHADPVKPCQACDGCFSKGRACVFDDGFARLSPLLEKADAIVFCGPLWWFSYSTQIKAVIDKLYAYFHAPDKLKGAMYLLMCAGDPSADIFSIVRPEFEQSVAALGLKMGGQLLVPGVLDKGDIKSTGALDEAEQLGRNLA